MATRRESGRTVAEALQLASLPESRWGAKGAGLSAEELGLAWAIVQAFPEQGGPPDLTWVRDTAHGLGLEPAAALAALEDHDFLVLDPGSGAITAAYPFSGTPTAHRVAVAGAQPVYANCAIDALGIPFMLGRDATVRSADPLSGESIRVDVRDAEARWSPSTAVLLCPAVDIATFDGPALTTCCPTINFFANDESAATYREAHSEQGWQLLTLAEAIDAGRRIFGTLAERPQPEADLGCTEVCGQA